jgi:hypothetical protein
VNIYKQYLYHQANVKPRSFSARTQKSKETALSLFIYPPTQKTAAYGRGCASLSERCVLSDLHDKAEKLLMPDAKSEITILPHNTGGGMAEREVFGEASTADKLLYKS